MYTINKKDWHICTFKIEEQNKEKKKKKNEKGELIAVGSSEPMVKRSVEPMTCHRDFILN